MVVDGCPSVVDSTCSRGGVTVWPETEIGETVMLSCPCGSPGSSLLPNLKATRTCGGSYDDGAQWEVALCGACQFHDSRLALCELSQVNNVPVYTWLYPLALNSFAYITSTSWCTTMILQCCLKMLLLVPTDWQSSAVGQTAGHGHTRCKHPLQQWRLPCIFIAEYYHHICARYKCGAGQCQVFIFTGVTVLDLLPSCHMTVCFC